MAHNNEHDEDIGVTVVLSEEASWIYHTHEGDNVGGTEVAVNLDGPNHFTRETENTNGTRQRPRAYGLPLLKLARGWTVVRVPYFEFDKVPFCICLYYKKCLESRGPSDGFSFNRQERPKTSRARNRVASKKARHSF